MDKDMITQFQYDILNHIDSQGGDTWKTISETGIVSALNESEIKIVREIKAMSESKLIDWCGRTDISVMLCPCGYSELNNYTV